MGDHWEELPLFPMDLVLFPYASLQVHVVDARFKSLIRHCVKMDQSFGIVLTRPSAQGRQTDDAYLVGTAARVLSVQSFDDGNLEVSVKGERRFRIRKLDESGEFPVGMVEAVVELEVESSPRAHALSYKTREYTEAYIASQFSMAAYKVAMVRLPQDMTALSFLVANLLHIENIEKQRMLETTDTLERLAELIPILERQILEASSKECVSLGPEALSHWLHPN
ncbi:MAG: LON peptidase substrate-binding domain-containing protein [Fimbriimonadaceae bacterium]